MMDEGLKPMVDIYELMKNLNMKDSEIDDVFLGRGEVNTVKAEFAMDGSCRSA